MKIYRSVGMCAKYVFKFVSNRITLIFVALFLQFIAYYGLILYLTERFWVGNILFRILSVIILLSIVNHKMNPAYKLTWSMFLLTMPVVGIIFYLFGGKSRIAKQMKDSFRKIEEKEACNYHESEEVRQHLELVSPTYSGQSRYLTRYSRNPCCDRTASRYFSTGEEWFSHLLSELKKAEKFIFMEYFIISKGKMWNSVLDILKEKVAQGVDVRLIYDGVGCLGTLPHRYYKELQQYGIKCACFNPFRPFLNIYLNNRDHKKITVIDGITAFSGGINLADEYINEKERFGHWKDAGILIHGDAAWNFTFMFLKMWNVTTHVEEAFDAFRPDANALKMILPDGFVQPYDDTPLDDETVGESVYLNMINHAQQYVYIFTPYLVLDNEMMTALCGASKRGVDVRIVTPGIPDKPAVFMLSRSFYKELLEAGVGIFEYSPGFIHSKCMVCDDVAAVVGTINMDYRSLYLHFENAVWLYRTSSVTEVKADAEKTFEESRIIDLAFCEHFPWYVKMVQSVLRMLAPLM